VQSTPYHKLSPIGQKVASWKMTKRHLERYYCDPYIKIFELKAQTLNWWWTFLYHLDGPAGTGAKTKPRLP
jgi:hypothetical protein